MHGDGGGRAAVLAVVAVDVHRPRQVPYSLGDRPRLLPRDAVVADRDVDVPQPVLLRELHHRVLHDVVRGLLVVHGEHALLECATLHRGEEIGQLLAGGQGFSIGARRSPLRPNGSKPFPTRRARVARVSRGVPA